MKNDLMVASRNLPKNIAISGIANLLIPFKNIINLIGVPIWFPKKTQFLF
ncbi:MAG: hypothetical protein LBJ13_02470 [Puniceicoccales bacterium]|nr:hypothetical protein [Puniceicoccales bacterium]